MGLNTITDFLQKKGIKSDGSPTRWSNGGLCPVLGEGVRRQPQRGQRTRDGARTHRPEADDHHHRTGQTEGTQRRPRGGHQEQRNRPARRNPAAEDPRQNRPLAKTEGRTPTGTPETGGSGQACARSDDARSGSSRCARGRTCPCTRSNPGFRPGCRKSRSFTGSAARSRSRRSHARRSSCGARNPCHTCGIRRPAADTGADKAPCRGGRTGRAAGQTRRSAP